LKSLYQRNYQGDVHLHGAKLPANCLKPKVFLGRRSIRQIRAPWKKLAAARATVNAEFACAKG
jgi:hypothetical protein